MKSRAKRTAARIALGVILSAGMIGFIGTQANASGTSGKTDGCYGEWWNTAFAGYCEPATVSQQYELVGICAAQGDYYGPWRYITKNSYVEPFDNSACRYSVDRSYVLATSG